MLFRQIADEKLSQYAYLVGCQRTGEALLIDPERDVDRYLTLIAEEGLRLTAVAETHIHADFLSGARELAERGVLAYLSGEGGPNWSYRWPAEGDYAHVLLHDGDQFRVGNVLVKALHTPGHTPEHLSFLITDEGGGADEPMGMVSGDFVFVGDTGRPDLLESAAGVEGAMRAGADALYRSVVRFLELPDYLQLWPGHGAGSACGKALGAVPESTVGYERRFSPALAAAGKGADAFLSYVLDAQPEPPLYFGRMKALNRDGPPLLDALPAPTPISASDLADLAGRRDVAVVDTRLDRSAYMRRHLAGSLYAPLDRTFPTVAGSYLDPAVPVYLLVSEAGVDEAVRALIRVGIDRIAGWAPPESLGAAADAGARMASTDEIDISDIELARRQPKSVVLDVRRLSEHLEGGVEGSLHIPHTRLAERLGELPTQQRLLVHCRTGARSAVASAFLERHGFDVVYVNGTLATTSEHAPTDA
jgi:hydroxyacylglutathione hydrolase